MPRRAGAIAIAAVVFLSLWTQVYAVTSSSSIGQFCSAFKSRCASSCYKKPSFQCEQVKESILFELSCQCNHKDITKQVLDGLYKEGSFVTATITASVTATTTSFVTSTTNAGTDSITATATATLASTITSTSSSSSTTYLSYTVIGSITIPLRKRAVETSSVTKVTFLDAYLASCNQQCPDGTAFNHASNLDDDYVLSCVCKSGKDLTVAALNAVVKPVTSTTKTTTTTTSSATDTSTFYSSTLATVTVSLTSTYVSVETVGASRRLARRDQGMIVNGKAHDIVLVMMTAPRIGDPDHLRTTIDSYLRHFPSNPEAGSFYSRLKIIVYTEFGTHRAFTKAKTELEHDTKAAKYLEWIQGVGAKYNITEHVSNALRLASSYMPTYVGLVEDDFTLCDDKWGQLLNTIGAAQMQVPDHCGVFVGAGGSGLFMKRDIAAKAADILLEVHMPADLVIQNCLKGNFPACQECRGSLVISEHLLMGHLGYDSSTFPGRQHRWHDYQCGDGHIFTGDQSVWVY